MPETSAMANSSEPSTKARAPGRTSRSRPASASRRGAASISRRPKPDSKSRAMREAGEHPAERRGLQHHERELERRVARAGSRRRAASLTRDSPPANAVKKNSGNSSAGSSSAGLVKKLCRLRHATASGDRAEARRSCARQPRAQRRRGRDQEDGRDRRAKPKASASACGSKPSMNRLRTASIRYETGFQRGDGAGTSRLDQVARQRHRGQEQEHEEQREHALHGLAVAQCAAR